LRDADRLFPRRLKIVAVFDQFSPERSHRGVLLYRIATWHVDRHRQSRAASREREALAVIAAGRRNQSLGMRLPATERIDERQSAPHLEGAGRIVILVLDDDLGPKRRASSGHDSAGVGCSAVLTTSWAARS